MKHVIFGAGVVGQATGSFLEANGEEVIYYDTSNEVIIKLTQNGKRATEVLPSTWDICWMCTHEKYLPSIIPSLPTKNSFIVIRSTVEPSLFDTIDTETILHMPEFLRENKAVTDIFFPDRIVIGGKKSSRNTIRLKELMESMYVNVPVFVVPQKISSLIKLTANAWLSTQITFWNEIFDILSQYPEYRQIVPNIVTTDARISKYGSIMVGKPFSGKCLPKDIDHILNIHKNSILLKAVKEANNAKQ